MRPSMRVVCAGAGSRARGADLPALLSNSARGSFFFLCRIFFFTPSDRKGNWVSRSRMRDTCSRSPPADAVSNSLIGWTDSTNLSIYKPKVGVGQANSWAISGFDERSAFEFCREMNGRLLVVRPNWVNRQVNCEVIRVRITETTVAVLR